MILDALQLLNTDNILDILPFLYNKEYNYPGGRISLLANNNVALTWYGYKFSFDGITITSNVVSSYGLNKDFTPEQSFDVYYEEKCSLLDPEKNITELDVIKVLMVTEYSLNLNDILLRRLLHYLVSYVNNNVYIIIIYNIRILYKENLLN